MNVDAARKILIFLGGELTGYPDEVDVTNCIDGVNYALNDGWLGNVYKAGGNGVRIECTDGFLTGQENEGAFFFEYSFIAHYNEDV